MSKPEDNSDMRILKTATCKTLSGKSTLKYQLGASPENVIYLRIAENDGGGMFSDEWVPFKAIQESLENDDEGAAITSVRLIPLFKGKTVNTPTFLLAALKHLKLVRPMKNKQRHHERLDPGPFLEQMEKLMSSSAAGKTKATTRKAPVRKASTKKAAIKKKVLSRKKTARTV
jgi:hypothetical protein